MRKFALFFLLCGAAAAADYVLIRGGTLAAGVRVDDFEMAVHPVTNAEYRLFIEATRRSAPLYWSAGQPPAGTENFPVIFVNRFDVAAYTRWLSRKEGRVYRLPTWAEFEYASRGGNPGAKYPWGDAEPAGKANFDGAGTRSFAEWRRYLKPVKSYPPNAAGLYDIAGNVWQMVDTHPDPAIATFTYRIEDPDEKENAMAGGSWARTAYYLRCGVRGSTSSGIRHPDIGFRLVRAPAASTHFELRPRRLVAVPAAGGGVYLNWQMLAEDTPATAFHLYRTVRRDSSGERITTAPVAATTGYTDPHPPERTRVYYRVRPVNRDREGAPSEWAGVDSGAEPTNLIASFEPTVQQGGFVAVFGDLDGDGAMDAVVRLDNGIHETSRDPGVPVELEAFASYGRSLWRRPLVRHDQCFGNANNVPVAVYDMNGDGKAEIVTRIQEGEQTYLAILEGMTGKLIRKTPWDRMVSDFAKSSTRVHLSIGYLDGRSPAVITQTGLYENEVFSAFDAKLNRLWTYNSFAETNGSGSHHIDVADVDGDGRDEILNGTSLLGPDGKLRWSIYRLHPDIVAVKHILPGSRDRQVYFAVESNVHAGAYLVDARTGKVIWKVNREDDPRWTHAHVGWASDIYPGSPGMEMLTNRDGHLSKDQVLFSATGEILANPFPPGWRPVNWTGAATRELLSGDGKTLGRFTGSTVETLDLPGPNTLEKASCGMTADLAGDYRDEVICTGVTAKGTRAILVFANTAPAARKQITRTASREYRLWLARNAGAGYASYFEWEP
jgi:rhamnogalacturonan endolyase